MPNSKVRFFILKLMMLVMMCAIIWTLFKLQILEGKQYKEVADNRITINQVEKAPRGEILDRYGTALVSNKVGYSILIQKAGMDNAELNSVFESVTDLLMSSDCEYYDTLPIGNAPYTFEFEDENGDGSTDDESQAWFDDNVYKDEDKYKDKHISSDMSADTVIETFKKIYEISPEYSEDQARRIIGARYEADLHGFSTVTPFTIADDVNVNIVTRIKENPDLYKNVTVSNDYVRVYNQPGLATHILGRTGKISAEEYSAKKDEGYGMNDIIGKQGIEQWAESYLKGEDGTTGSLKQVDGEEVTVIDNKEPVPGDYVILTIDSELQKYTEDSLARTIKSISANGTKNKGADCDAGAAVVIDVKTGELLTCASYPTYDMSRFDEIYSELLKDDANPLWNRAVSGTYSPGSTFKPLSAIAALQSGNLTVDEIITDEGIYKYYGDYQPACWIWTDYHLTHGPINVSQAIENSCNYFFYEVGKRMGIETLDEYAKKFGLGLKTGVELSEEVSGHMASPEYKKEVVSSVTDQSWFGGDTLQAAIGQSYSLFTPIQLANYAATIANDGVRHKVNLIKSIRSSVDGSVVKEFEPQVEETIDMSDEVLNAVKNGMRKVTDEGSASDIFADYKIAVGGKTGTAQLGNGSNNAVFIAYAPFDDPQIAVAVVLEHGVAGTNAGYVVRDIFDKYFEKEIASANAAQAQAQAAAQASSQPSSSNQPAEQTQTPVQSSSQQLLP